MEPADAWTEEDVMDAIQQWKGIAVELAQTLELEQEDAPSVSAIATLEEELNEDWQAVWTTFLDDLRTAERLDAPSMDVGQTGTSVLNWRTGFGWLVARERDNALGLVAVERRRCRGVGAQLQWGGLGIGRAFAGSRQRKQLAKGTFECPADHEERPSSGGGAACCHAFSRTGRSIAADGNLGVVFVDA